MNRLAKIELEIRRLKRRLRDLWELKGKADQEILDLADEIDRLLNEYDRCLKAEVNPKKGG
jgi:hypothetical protein